MNDNDLDWRVQEAFDGIEVPDEAKRQALAYVLAQGRKGRGAQREGQAAPQLDAAHPASGAVPGGQPAIRAVPRSAMRFRRVTRFVGGAIAACVVLAAVGFGAFRLGAGQAAIDAPGVEVPGAAASASASASAAEGADGGQPADSASRAGDGQVAALDDTAPTAFVDIDINPSIQLQLNSADEVVAAEGINEDGARLLLDASLDGLPYERALRTLIASDAIAPYLDGDAFVSVSVSSSNEAQQQALTMTSETCLADGPYQVDCRGVSRQLYDEAHGHGMGCGRYAAAVELTQLDPTVSVEDCASMTMRELRDRIAACKAASEGGAGNGAGAGGGHGGHGAHHGWR